MSDNSKPTQNDALSFEQWLDRAKVVTEEATPGPWEEDGSLIGPRPGASVAQVWGVRWEADGAFIAHARTALPQAVAALRATLDMHAKIVTDQHIDGPTTCAACGKPAEGFAIWPCPTVAAITEALGGA